MAPLEKTIWGFPKIRGTLFGVPIIRNITFWGLYWGPLILGNYHLLLNKTPRRTSLLPLGEGRVRKPKFAFESWLLSGTCFFIIHK